MSEAFVVGVGATSPFGLDARQCALVSRANKLTPRPSAIRDENGHRLASVRAISLPEDLYGFERMLALLVPALREAVLDAGLTGLERPLPLFLALPEARVDDDARLGTAFVQALASRSGVKLDLRESVFFRVGAVGMAAALQRARKSGTDGTPVLVGGVDSFHHPTLLPWLQREKRLLSGEVPDGIIPSEGAAIALVAGPRHRGTRFARIVDAAIAVQPEPEPNDARNGEAFSELVRRMALSNDGRAFRWALPDVNGERHRVNEWIITKLRNDDLFSSECTVEERLADQCGETGAATGALYLSYITSAFRLGFAPADRALMVLSGEGPERGSILLDRR